MFLRVQFVFFYVKLVVSFDMICFLCQTEVNFGLQAKYGCIKMVCIVFFGLL